MTTHRFTRSAALGLALAAVAAPTASAQIHDETIVGARQPALVSSQIHRETVVLTPKVMSALSQIRDETVARASQPTPIRAETVVQSPQTSPAPVSSPSADGIDWADVGIGAGGVLALIALGAGGAYVVVRHRHEQPDQLRNLTVTGADGR